MFLILSAIYGYDFGFGFVIVFQKAADFIRT